MTEAAQVRQPAATRNGSDESTNGPEAPLAHPLMVAALAIASVAALVARFVVPTPLWLDEALSVNIAKLPLGDIAEALRHDGHPPLYYYVLHGWMELFGEGDRAVRALSGLISLAALPLAYRVGRRTTGSRLGWLTVAALCLSPFFLRYGSETRMYSLVMVLVLAGYLAVLNALEAPRLGWWLIIAGATAALLWTHYWSLWFLAAVTALLVVRLVVRWRRQHQPDRATLAVLMSMAAGGVLFLPWVSTMLFQAERTGTPWAKPFRPATLVVTALTDFSGGPFSEPQVLMLFSVVLLAIGVF
ncbi:MAG TPA: glycosyltransferase family 39 protein, partial [Microthrixaceae bacterium]|nr:glycosyltransferase family 39 protein [Microthrixaceae bacterium]